MLETADPRPFLGEPWCAVVLPDLPEDPWTPITGFAALLISEAAELEAELGCSVRWMSATAAEDAPARCLIGPAEQNPGFDRARITAASGPAVLVDRDRCIVAIDGPTLPEVGEAFQVLRTAVRSGAVVTKPTIPDSATEIHDSLATEVWHTFPSFALRGIDWRQWAADGIVAGSGGDVSLASLQRWFAGLQDAHTWVKDSRINARLPYRAWIDRDSAWLVHVPRWSAAWTAGVRAGDTLLDVDQAEWWARTGATPRARAVVSGHRWLAGSTGSVRELRAVGPDGAVRRWQERYEPTPWITPVSWRVLPSATGYLRIRGWEFSLAWHQLMDAALNDLGGCPRLLVDLRGNVGGNLVAAQRFRDRFLPAETELGFVQFSIGNGRLSEPAALTGTPPTRGRWERPVRFLIDRSTYSASEDAVLGLGGLDQVQVVGEPSGGGSGRPRTISLPNGFFATISTALTFDRRGHGVEAHGLSVDLALPIDEHLRDPRRVTAGDILRLADEHW
jgi:carboxyl-terminal processing protease